MPTMTRCTKPTCLCGAILAALLAVVLWAAFTADAAAEDSQPPAGAPTMTQPAPPAPATVAPSVPAQSPTEKPGFMHQLKVWWDDSVSFIDATIKDTRGKVEDFNKKSSDATQGAADAAKGAATATQDAMKSAVEATKGAAATAQDAMKNAMEATKNAATAIVRLPNTRVVEVREPCARAPNGAPDCEAAAANGCRGKGFASGHPLDVRTAEHCDTTALQNGRPPRPGECPIETVVTRAVCQ